jgi:hypothetical protein
MRITLSCNKIFCKDCLQNFYIKPSFIYDEDYVNIYIYEIIYRNLLNYISENVFINIHPPKAKIINLKHKVVLIEDLGDHSRIGGLELENIIYPNWIYYMDAWTSRIDCDGDTNLLLIDNKSVPIDF